jgi:Flp pilus assembly protein TadD
MKTTLPGMILGGMMALTLAACNTTPMNSDSTSTSTSTSASTSASGSSQAAMTGSSDGMKADGTTPATGKAPVNCTTNTAADGTNAANNPGAKCPTESH